jgi:hypothetical protein
MTQATGSPAFIQNQSDPRYSQFLKKMGRIIWKWGKPFGSGIPVSWN